MNSSYQTSILSHQPISNLYEKKNDSHWKLSYLSTSKIRWTNENSINCWKLNHNTVFENIASHIMSITELDFWGLTSLINFMRTRECVSYQSVLLRLNQSSGLNVCYLLCYFFYFSSKARKILIITARTWSVKRIGKFHIKHINMTFEH